MSESFESKTRRIYEEAASRLGEHVEKAKEEAAKRLNEIKRKILK